MSRSQRCIRSSSIVEGLLAAIVLGASAGCHPGTDAPGIDGGAEPPAGGAARPTAEPESVASEPPPGSGLTSIGPEGETRIYYQFVDGRGNVRFVERLDDVPAAWRDRVGFVELPGPPPLTPAEARRASRADPAFVGRLSAPTIVLYSAPWCGYCRQARRYLDDRGIPYALRDVDVPAAKAELVALTGGGGIPVLDVDGRVLRGFSTRSYDEFLGSIEL